MTATDLDLTPAGLHPHMAPHPHHARRWLILAVLGLAQLTVVLDATIVNIALPTAQRALGFSTSDRQWIVTAYALAFGALLPLGGRVGDFVGSKRTLLTGLAGFAIASAVGGAATSFGVLVTARAAQGLFGALLAPAVLSLMTTTFTDAKERAKAFGVYGAIAGAGGAIGLLAGGILTEYLNWRWCMFVNIIFAGLAVAGGAVLLHHQRTANTRHRLDIPGTLTVSAGLFAAVYGFSNAETHDWNDATVWGWLAAAVVLLAAFVTIETRAAHPLIPLRVIVDRTRGGALLAVLILGAGTFAVFLFLTYYLQQTLGFSPVRSGVAFLPMIGALSVTATGGAALLAPRTGPRPLVPAGFLVATAGMLWLTRLDATSTYTSNVLGPLIIIGLGLGLAMAPAMTAGTAGIHAADTGVASALLNTSQQIGGSIGTAVLSTIAANALTDSLAGRIPNPQVLAAATIDSYTITFAWIAGFFAAGALISALLLRSGPLRPDADAAVAVHM